MLDYSVMFANYTIGPNAYETFPLVCSNYGTKLFLIGGENAMKQAMGALKNAMKGSNLTIVAKALFGNDCTYARIHELAKIGRDSGAEVVVGIGGGKALDTAKGTAYEMGVPVITLPTIAATCAATTALSVVYREDGSFDSFYFYERPAVHSFINTDIIAKAPEKYLRAGMGDTIGKHFECHMAARGDKLDHNSALGREISNMCYAPIVEHGVQAMADCKNNTVSYALQQVVLANIVSTGLVSLLVEDCYNCAIAHSLFYGLAILPQFEERNLHGDVVAYGVLVQLAIDKQKKKMQELYAFLKQLGMPVCLADMGIQTTDRQWLEAVLEETVKGPDMEHLPYIVTKDMVYEGVLEIETLSEEENE
ncbi:MAG: iron-containing alcohol dehydrogenase family protein [Candidatus Fimimorpha sp.]